MVNTITSNVAAYGAQSNIGAASVRASASISRLSSGNAINRASDDVAGLATGTSLRTQVTSLRTALANTTQGSSLLQVADGSLSQIVDILQRQKALSVQAGSGSLTDTNRQLLNQEFQALTNEVNRIAATTSFNGVSLLSGGLGEKTQLMRDDLVVFGTFGNAPALNPTGGAVSQARAVIAAFDINTGALLSSSATLGSIQFQDAEGNGITNASYLSVNQSVYGQFSKFEITNVNYGAAGVGSGTLSATLNGVEYKGTVIANGGNTDIRVSNGNTYMSLTVPPLALDNAGTVENTVANITNIFSTTIITRANTIEGVNFEGTLLDGTIGSGPSGNASIRIAGNGTVDIRNFKYEGNDRFANTSILSVEINGRKFIATGVNDSIPFFFGAPIIQFTNPGGSEVLSIDLSKADLVGHPISNIRTNMADRQGYIDALNIGFSRSGQGLNFGVGASTQDTINIRYGSATTVNIYGGQSLDVSSAATAATASTVLDGAINQVISLRASVGALQSRFNFAGQSIQSSIESQDRARGALLDTDVAKESTRFAAAQVQLQAGVSVLAQANLLPSNLLNLLEGGLLGG